MIEPRSILSLLATADRGAAGMTTDFVVGGAVERAFVARSRTGNAALLVPLDEAVYAAGRRGAGFTLIPHAAVEFQHDGRHWTQPAAVVECLDSELLDTFIVLVADVVSRLPHEPDALAWSAVLALVDEWQMLLASRGRLSTEREMGLWSELWLIAESSDADRLVAGWRGPEGNATDFVIGGVGIEMKASRRRHAHHLSLSQVETPLGDLQAFMLSMWVGVDPEIGSTLVECLSRVLERVSDSASLLRTIARVGYAPADRGSYTTRFVLLEEPWWIPVERVPRVHRVDAGVSDVRYIAALDESMRTDDATNARLWNHVLGKPVPHVQVIR